jgi:VanZ family protein
MAVQKLNKFHLFVVLTCTYAISLFYLSSGSSIAPLSEPGFLSGLVHFLEDLGLKKLLYPFSLVYLYPDKFAHVILYLGFGLLLYQTVKRSKNGVLSNHAALLSVLLGALFAITDEVHQAFVPYRTASSMDLVADVTGLLFAQLLILLYVGAKRLFKPS